MGGKVVIVGDGAIGKTFLLTSLLQEAGVEIDWECATYQPTAAENLSAEWTYTDAEGGMHDFNMEIWDTAGQEALKSLRSMAYPDTDIFMIGYDMTRKNTLENIVSHDLNDLKSYNYPEHDDDFDDVATSWGAELVQHCESDFHIILVGTKADYWEELNASGTPEQKAELTTWQQGYASPGQLTPNPTSRLLPRPTKASWRAVTGRRVAKLTRRLIQTASGLKARSANSVQSR